MSFDQILVNLWTIYSQIVISLGTIQLGYRMLTSDEVLQDHIAKCCKKKKSGINLYFAFSGSQTQVES